MAIALGDVAWISLAFALGFAARMVNLPPLVGFLATGFLLNAFGVSSGELLDKIADLGITLLLFTIGLKLNPGMLLRPQVWLVTALHTSLVVLLFGSGLFLLALSGAALFQDLDLPLALLLAFALSFSSTVFVAKTLEEKGEMKSLHGRFAIGILIMQDLAAVIFLGASTGELPSPWALALLLLIPMRPLLHMLLQRTGHGELLVMYGLVLALGGAELFELGGVKDDLGALFMGLLISTHPKAVEMAKNMFGFKDLFLVGFFLSIGLTGELSGEAVLIGALLVPFVFIKSALFYVLMTKLGYRARTALLSTLNLSNYSEFGLIVVAIGVANSWLAADWLTILAIALSLSFVVSAPLTRQYDRIYSRYHPFWLRFQRAQRLADDPVLDTNGATIAVFGMGRVGTGTYDRMVEIHGDSVVGVDFDLEKVQKHQQAGRNCIRGAPSDADFWDQMDREHHITLVMLALPTVMANLDALDRLREIRFKGRIAATARYPDDEATLKQAGAHAVFSIYSEAGTGFADLVETHNLMPADQPLESAATKLRMCDQ